MSASSVATVGLTQADFLKVLVAQYSNQIPTDSQDSNQFYTDLMNMSNYQAIQDTSIKLGGLSAQQLVGKTITATNSDGESSTGKVASARFDGTDWYLSINGSEFTLNQVTGIAATADTTSSATSN